MLSPFRHPEAIAFALDQTEPFRIARVDRQMRESAERGHSSDSRSRAAWLESVGKKTEDKSSEVELAEMMGKPIE
jgi:hypothetical protein